MKLKYALGIAVLASAGGALADTNTMGDKAMTKPAAPATKTMTDSFDALDTNHDGYLTKTEAQGQVADFAKADVNKDGHLNKTEFASAATTSKKSPSASDSSS